MKEHNKIKISREEYIELITCRERIEAVNRIVSRSGYVTVNELLAVLDVSELKKVGVDVGKL